MNTNQQNYLQITFIIRHTSISVFICRKDDKLEIDLHVTLNDIIAYNSTTQFLADYIHHQTSFSFRKLCIEDDKLTIDLHGTLSDILEYHIYLAFKTSFPLSTVLLFHVLRDDENMGFYNFISISKDYSEVLMDHDSIYFDCQDSL
jgi:hypothetical protein